MKAISVTKVKKELKKIGASESVTDLIINNISLYNDLVAAYHEGDRKNMYLMYQLNAQIDKQLKGCIKVEEKNPDKEEDTFGELLKTLNKKKMETR